MKRAPIKFTTLPPESFVPLDHPAPEHRAEARVPEHTALTPVAFFNFFWDDSILERIVQATNDYANARRAAWSAKMPGTLQHQRRWKTLNIAELKRFLGITILSGIIRLPSRHLYWSFRRNSLLSTSGAALSFNRYTQIKRYLHVSAPTTTPLPRKDWWGKLEPLSSNLRKRSQVLYCPSTHIAADASMAECCARTMHTVTALPGSMPWAKPPSPACPQ